MRVILVSIFFLSSACNSNLLVDSSQKPSPYKASKNKDGDKLGEDIPESLEGRLEMSLDFFAEVVGDSEFTYNGLTFANFESMLRESLDFVQDRGIEADIEDENPIFDDLSHDERLEFFSDFSLNYGEHNEIDSEESGEDEESFELLQDAIADARDGISKRVDSLEDRINDSRFSTRWGDGDISTADRRWALLERAESASVYAGYNYNYQQLKTSRTTTPTAAEQLGSEIRDQLSLVDGGFSKQAYFAVKKYLKPNE